MAHRGVENAYGDLAERRAKVDSKYDTAVEAAQVAWIEHATGIKKTGTFQSWLKSGIVLCALLNKLEPGLIKGQSESELAFKQMENISKFLKGCLQYGVRSTDCFQTPDLFEGTNMTQVQVTINNLRRIEDLKIQGIKVEPQTAAESIMLRSTKVTAPTNAGPVKPLEKSNKTGLHTAYTAPKEDTLYGDLADRMAKLDAKYDRTLESSLQQWIERTTGESIGPDFQAGLKNGVILCKLMNALKPGSCPAPNASTMAFKQMENINQFLKAAGALGVKGDDLFQTVALYEGSNMSQVLITLSAVKRVSGQ